MPKANLVGPSTGLWSKRTAGTSLGLTDCWMLLSGAYHFVAPDLEVQAEEYARISYKICIGEDETFDETYGKLAK
jgi:hypothetical protein